MSALRFLTPSFPPTISQINLFGVSKWPEKIHRILFRQPEELTDCPPPRMQTLHGRWLFVFTQPAGRSRAFWHLAIHRQGCDSTSISSAQSAGKGMEDELASLLVSLFHLRDPYKRGRFSLQIMLRENDSMEKVHEVYVSLKKDGYAFEICQVTESIVPEYLYQVGIDDVPRHREDVSWDKDDFWVQFVSSSTDSDEDWWVFFWWSTLWEALT